MKCSIVERVLEPRAQKKWLRPLIGLKTAF